VEVRVDLEPGETNLVWEWWSTPFVEVCWFLGVLFEGEGRGVGSFLF